MKKTNGLKRLLAFLTAIVMVLGCVMINVYAEDSGWYANNDDNILQVKSYLSGRSYKTYQLFTGDESKAVLSNIKWGVSVKDSAALIAALQSETLVDGRENTIKGVFSGNISTASDLANKLLSISTSDATDTFAYIVINELESQGGEALTTNTAIALDSADLSKGYHYSFGSLHDGYYLVEETTEVAANETASRFMVKVNGPTTIVTKAESGPSIDKNIVTNGVTGTGETLAKYDDVAIDETVTFKLSSAVPNMSGYNKYFYIIEDVLSEGLTYSHDTDNMVITVGTKTLEEGDDYYVKDPVSNDDGTTTVKIVFKNFIQYDQGSVISVYYDATVNDKAAIGNSTDNYNKVKLNYSNNPNVSYIGENPENPNEPGDEPKSDGSESIGNTEWETVYVYTTAVRLIKVNEKNDRLTGAVFTLKSKGENGGATKTLIKVRNTYVPVAYYEKSDVTAIESALANNTAYYVKKSDGNFDRNTTNLYEEAIMYNESHQKDVNGTLYYNVSDSKYESTMSDDKTYSKEIILYELVTYTDNVEEAQSVTWTGTVGDDGVLEIEGLPTGEYEITEITAPDGYNLLENPISFKVALTVNATTYVPKWDVTIDTTGGVNYKEDEQRTPDDGIHVTRIINKAGTTLPSTGGMGTTLFYVLGSILLIGASILLITKSRMKNNGLN